MDFQEDDCPSCLKHLGIPPGYIEEIVAAKRSSGTGVAEDNIYNGRLDICYACEFCPDGVMCRMCGCFVQFRALSLSSTCPHPGGSRWLLEMRDNSSM